MATTIAAPPVVAAGTWAVDPERSTVGFAVRHLGVATIQGAFRAFDGVLEIGADGAESRAHGTVGVASLDTGDAKRDGNLCSPGFFDADTEPEIRFASTRVAAIDPVTYWIVGDLTLGGVTDEVVLTAEIVDATRDEARFAVTSEISRQTFGLRFRHALRSGNALVADTVRLSLDIAAVRRA